MSYDRNSESHGHSDSPLQIPDYLVLLITRPFCATGLFIIENPIQIKASEHSSLGYIFTQKSHLTALHHISHKDQDV
jgi:hypothetical protein